MRYRIHTIFIHNSRTNTFVWLLRTTTFAKLPSVFFLKYMFAAVVGNIYKGRLKFHQWMEMFV